MRKMRLEVGGGEVSLGNGKRLEGRGKQRDGTGEAGRSPIRQAVSGSPPGFAYLLRAALGLRFSGGVPGVRQPWLTRKRLPNPVQASLPAGRVPYLHVL